MTKAALIIRANPERSCCCFSFYRLLFLQRTSVISWFQLSGKGLDGRPNLTFFFLAASMPSRWRARICYSVRNADKTDCFHNRSYHTLFYWTILRLHRIYGWLALFKVAGLVFNTACDILSEISVIIFFCSNLCSYKGLYIVIFCLIVRIWIHFTSIIMGIVEHIIVNS